MHRLKLIGAFLCILSAWMQFLAPVAAMSMSAEASPFAVICAKADEAATKSSATNGKDSGAPHAPSHHHDHQHCPLCQAYLGASPLPERPAFTAFDYPAASPLRWRVADKPLDTGTGHKVFQARGPPSLI